MPLLEIYINNKQVHDSVTLYIPKMHDFVQNRKDDTSTNYKLCEAQPREEGHVSALTL